MTLIILLLWGFGSALMVSAWEGTSLTETVKGLWNDQLFTGAPPPVHPGSGGNPYGGPIPPSGAPGVRPLFTSGGAGPGTPGQQQDAYQLAVVRAYLQSQR